IMGGSPDPNWPHQGGDFRRQISDPIGICETGKVESAYMSTNQTFELGMGNAIISQPCDKHSMNVE
ncbi:MAG: hypothetical protein ACREAC_20605, partial [Blastocatellia bacterium]